MKHTSAQDNMDEGFHDNVDKPKRKPPSTHVHIAPWALGDDNGPSPRRNTYCPQARARADASSSDDSIPIIDMCRRVKNRDVAVEAPQQNTQTATAGGGGQTDKPRSVDVGRPSSSSNVVYSRLNCAWCEARHSGQTQPCCDEADQHWKSIFGFFIKPARYMTSNRPKEIKNECNACKWQAHATNGG